ncbi:unnamed protein product [Darwinula stevensoni]|uniref:Peptidase S1 domain-containing protein n=1 Tax=Darwinula stevensoni TaxID=69355 RepID=A0A7R8XBI8_9CRUS|nr:unnamed protein product [Darwinula stevensoni]CAG0886672.1 unnamed protein product [Darwinula stevensoni]
MVEAGVFPDMQERKDKREKEKPSRVPPLIQKLLEYDAIITKKLSIHASRSSAISANRDFWKAVEAQCPGYFRPIGTEQKRYIRRTYLHPQLRVYSTYAINDIGIVKFDRPLDLGSRIQLARVASPDTDIDVAGWGVMGRSSSNHLMETSVHIEDDAICSWFWGNKFIRNKMLCTSDDSKRKDACSGDSGAPLMCKGAQDRDWYVTGLVSFGLQCKADEQVP